MTQNPEVISIPQDIREEISKKGFHLYKWISPEEVKLSIERDFLHVMKYVGGVLAVVSILSSFINYGDTGSMLGAFFMVVGLGVLLIFIYLLLVSLRRSFLLTKSAFVVLTDSSISLGGKIVKLSDISSLKQNIKNVEDTFEEDLFSKSQLSDTKGKLKKEVLSQIFGGYKIFFRENGKKSRLPVGKGDNSEKAILLIIALYTLYVGVMSIVYFVGVLFLWVFGKIITWVNTHYLIMRGHKVMKINKLFGETDILSEAINDERMALKNNLKQAKNNEWKDGLLLEINAGIKNISSTAEEATSKVVELRDTIYSSRYNDMFSFDIYHRWIKKQIVDPLEKIISLLEKNKDIIEMSILKIQDQLANPLKSEFSASLKMQEKRLIMQRNDIETFVPKLRDMIERLQ